MISVGASYDVVSESEAGGGTRPDIVSVERRVIRSSILGLSIVTDQSLEVLPLRNFGQLGFDFRCFRFEIIPLSGIPQMA